MTKKINNFTWNFIPIEEGSSKLDDTGTIRSNTIRKDNGGHKVIVIHSQRKYARPSKMTKKNGLDPDA